MTTYILAGGCDRKHPTYVWDIARIIAMKTVTPKILSVCFSMSKEDGDRKFSEYHEYFLTHFPKGTEFVRAHHDNFIQQVRDADVVYFHGGHTSLLVSTMQQYPDIKSEFKGKIVIGSSAGANYLARYGFSPSTARVGLTGGILNVAVVVHYGSSGFGGMTFKPEFWDRAVKSVREASGEDEVILLPEGMFTVIEQ